MRHALAAAALLILVLPAAAAAQNAETPEHTIGVDFDACVEKDPSTAGMMECSGAAESAWDRELNAAYRELVGALKGDALEALKQAQRAWVAQRDREFALQGAIRGELDGTMWGPIIAGQRVALVKARALQLRAYKEFLDNGRP